MHPGHVRMHGNMYDYKIKYGDIERYFLLPKPDNVNYVFLICLERPIRQGQQKYQYLVWQTPMRQEELAINLDAAQIAEKWGEGCGLSPLMDGQFHHLVAKVEGGGWRVEGGGWRANRVRAPG